MIPAFRYVDGALVRCENYGPHMVLPGKPPDRVPQTLTKRERRAAARRGLRGRRSAHSVPRVVMVSWMLARTPQSVAQLPEPVALRGHRLSNGRAAVLLYLEAGEPTEAQIRDVESALRDA